MQTPEIITIIQLVVGILLLGLSIAIGLGTRRAVPPDLRSSWAVLIGLLFFFILGYCAFLYITALGVPFHTELLTGSVFLGGACFVIIVLMLTKATVQRLIDKEGVLNKFNEELVLRSSELEDEISVRMKVQKNLMESEDKYRSLVESTDDSIYVVDRDKRYIFINAKHQKRLGLTEGNYEGRHYADFHSERQTQWFTSVIDQVFDTGESSQYDYQSERDASFFLQTMSPVKSKDGTVRAVSVISKNITPMKQLEQELRHITFTDDLTGLFNRRGFITLADQQLKMANRVGRKVYMLYVDLDYLKLINDTLGHAEGDRALIKLGMILRDTYRNSDIIARIGGDEFVVFPVEGDEGDIATVTNRLEENIELENSRGESQFELSVSTGIACYDPSVPATLDQLLIQADRSMYAEKKKKPPL